MNESLRTPSDGERADVHLRHLVESMVREGYSGIEISVAVNRAAGRRWSRRPPRGSQSASRAGRR